MSFTAFCWEHRGSKAFALGLRDCARAYALDLLPSIGDASKRDRLESKLKACDPASQETWANAARTGGDLKSSAVQNGFDFAPAYWPAHIAAQMAGCTPIDAALDMAWAIRRATGITDEHLLDNLKDAMSIHQRQGAA